MSRLQAYRHTHCFKFIFISLMFNFFDRMFKGCRPEWGGDVGKTRRLRLR